MTRQRVQPTRAQTRATVATYAGEHKGPVTTVAASGARQFVTGSWDKTAVLWDVEVSSADAAVRT